MKRKTKTELKKGRGLSKSDHFFILQGLTRGFLEWVLKKADEKIVYQAFDELYGETILLGIEDNIIPAFIGLAIQDEMIDQADINKLLRSLKRFDKDGSYYGWMADSAKKFVEA
jgi:hypothetical protein